MQAMVSVVPSDFALPHPHVTELHDVQQWETGRVTMYEATVQLVNLATACTKSAAGCGMQAISKSQSQMLQ